MSADAPFVRAIAVTAGRAEYLGDTLSALARQDAKVDAWHLAVVGHRSDDDLGIPPGLGIPVIPASASTFGEAVDRVLSAHPSEPDEWLWLLHDDSAPLPDCLSRLLATARNRRTAGVVGPFQVRWDDPSRLVGVGVTVSRSGRRLNPVDQDDVDQGQHESREDVLAVGLAGALVRRDVWERLGGTDPAYGVFGDSTDFCRRVWRSGADVVVAPKARVRHAQATLAGRNDRRGRKRNHVRLRASEWYHALAWASPGAVPVLLARIGLSSLGRALVRLAAGEPRLALADLSVPPTLLSMLSKLRRSRAAVKRAGTTPTERRLLASFPDVVGHIRNREFGLYESWRAENRPNDMQRRELSRLGHRRHLVLAGVCVVLTGLSVALYGTWLAPLMRGDMLVGSSLGVTDVSLGDLFRRTWTGWNDAGLGQGSLDGTFAALMIPFALMGGLSLGIGLLLALSPLAAGIAAWFAAGAATRSLWARSIAAVAWGVWPTLLVSVADGRVGAVLVHILLPLFALGLARASGVFRREVLGDGEEFPRGRAGSQAAAAAAAILLVAVATAAPILLIPLVLLTWSLTVFARGYRLRIALVPLPALLVNGPALWQAWSERAADRWWSVLVREPGPALASDPVSGWDLLWGIGEAPPTWPSTTETGNLILTYLIGATLVALAVASLGNRRSQQATRMGMVVAASGLAAAIISQRTVAVGLGLDGSAAANGWPGPGLSLLSLGMFLSVLSAWRPRPDKTSGIGRSATAIAVSLVLAVHVTATVWPGREFGGDVHPSGVSVLPLVADLERASAPATRVLVLSTLDDGTVAYSVTGSDGSSALLGRSHRPEGEGTDVSVLSPPVSEMAGSGSGSGGLLRDWGIGVVVVAPGSEGLQGSLMLVPDLALIGASDLGVSWKVLPDAGGGKVARAWIEEPDGRRLPLDSSPSGLTAWVPEGGPERILVLAVPPDERWSATLDGEPLESVDVDGRQGFGLGEGSGVLKAGYGDPAYRVWWIVGCLAVLWAFLGGIPLRDRAYRKELR